MAVKRKGQCHKITILLGCRIENFGPQKDNESRKFGGKCGMNYIYAEICGDFSAFVAIL